VEGEEVGFGSKMKEKMESLDKSRILQSGQAERSRDSRSIVPCKCLKEEEGFDGNTVYHHCSCQRRP
jgi:hypothetical protein